MNRFPFLRLSLPVAIRTIQDRLGMTDQDIADELGVQPSTVRRWKTGRHVPAYGTIRPLQAIARRANVEIDPSSMVRLNKPLSLSIGEGMEREPDSLVEQVLNWEYRKALAEGAAPVFLSGGKDWEGWKEFEEAFPEPPEVTDEP